MQAGVFEQKVGGLDAYKRAINVLGAGQLIALMG